MSTHVNNTENYLNLISKLKSNYFERFDPGNVYSIDNSDEIWELWYRGDVRIHVNTITGKCIIDLDWLDTFLGV